MRADIEVVTLYILITTSDGREATSALVSTEPKIGEPSKERNVNEI